MAACPSVSGESKPRTNGKKQQNDAVVNIRFAAGQE
jgi:hypothetical protein